MANADVGVGEQEELSRVVDVAPGSGGAYLLVGAVGFAALVGWSTAATALRPLDAVTETALQITRADVCSLAHPCMAPEPPHFIRATSYSRCANAAQPKGGPP